MGINLGTACVGRKNYFGLFNDFIVILDRYFAHISNDQLCFYFISLIDKELDKETKYQRTHVKTG